MKITTLITTNLWLMAVGILAGCTSEETIEKNEQKQQHEAPVVATFTGNQPKESSSAKTRTTATHVMGNPANVFWEATDKIWVRDDNGTFRQSEAATFPTSSNKARANFKLTGNYKKFNPEVRYTNTGNPNTVQILYMQYQKGSDNFNHLSTAGDCGTATAVGGGGDYEFTLQHKASYICFLPRNRNKELNPRHFKLARIVIDANKPITGTFDFSDGSLVGKTPIANSQSIAILMADFSDPPELSTQEEGEQSGCYLVIPPGTYNLNVNYWFSDPVTLESISIPKTYIGLNCPEGKIVDITANLTLPEWGKYYMWDAQYHYWWGHESEQPLVNGGKGTNYPRYPSDPRWFNVADPGLGKVFEGQTDLFKTIPNVNEMLWYIYHGDPHWESPKWRLMVRDGHVVNFNMGGLWLKKKAKIMADEGITEEQMKKGYPKANPKDWRATTITSLPPAVTPSTAPVPNTVDYFFLPAMGYFLGNGEILNLGTVARYWTSTASFNYRANQFFLEFNSGSVHLGFGRGYHGFQARAFE